MTPLHDELREGRERRGLTLDALHTVTRINRDALEAVERGDFDFLPKTYIRLFLRTYATQVGMDPQYVLDRYEELNSPPAGEIPVVIPQQRPVSWGTVMALTVGFFLLGWAGITAFKNRRGDQYPTASRGGPSTGALSAPESTDLAQGSAVQTATTDTTPPATAASPAESTIDTATARLISGSSAWWGQDSVVVLRGVCVEQTWLDISADGQRVFRGEMKPGEEQRWSARDRFYIVAGRSSGIQFSLQDRSLPRAPSWASEVLRMSVTRKGIEVERKRRPAEASEDSAARPGPAADTGR